LFRQPLWKPIYRGFHPLHGDIDERKYDKPPNDDKASEDNNEENTDYRPDTGVDDKPTEQSDEREYDKPPNEDKASEVKDEVKADYKPDTGVDDKSAESGGPDEELVEGVDNDKTHDGEYASEQVPESTHQNNKMTFTTAMDGGDIDTTNMLYMKPISPSIPPSQDYYTFYLTSACSSPDTSSMKAACPPTTRDFEHMYASLSCVDTTALMAENVHLKEMLVTQLDLIQQQVNMSERQFLEEFLVLNNRIKKLEDMALKQQKELTGVSGFELDPTNGPTEPAEEVPSTPTPSQELQKQQRFWLPPPRQDPNKIMVEYNIPELIVNILMVRAKEQNCIMSYLRSICYPAKIWIPYREIHNRSPFRKLLLMGWTKEVLDDAREIIYNFINTEIGENIPSLHPVLSQQDVWETWSRSPPPMKTGHESLNQTASPRSMVSKNEDYQHDPHTPDGSQRRCDSARWGQPNRTSNDHPEYGNNVEVATPEMSSDDDDLAAVLDLPPVKVKTELKKEIDIMVIMSDEEDVMDNTTDARWSTPSPRLT
jgi:hypothetical protein